MDLSTLFQLIKRKRYTPVGLWGEGHACVNCLERAPSFIDGALLNGNDLQTPVPEEDTFPIQERSPSYGFTSPKNRPCERSALGLFRPNAAYTQRENPG